MIAPVYQYPAGPGTANGTSVFHWNFPTLKEHYDSLWNTDQTLNKKKRWPKNPRNFALHHQAEVFTDIFGILFILQLLGVWQIPLESVVVPPTCIPARQPMLLVGPRDMTVSTLLECEPSGRMQKRPVKRWNKNWKNTCAEKDGSQNWISIDNFRIITLIENLHPLTYMFSENQGFFFAGTPVSNSPNHIQIWIMPYHPMSSHMHHMCSFIMPNKLCTCYYIFYTYITHSKYHQLISSQSISLTNYVTSKQRKNAK